MASRKAQALKAIKKHLEANPKQDQKFIDAAAHLTKMSARDFEAMCRIAELAFECGIDVLEK